MTTAVFLAIMLGAWLSGGHGVVTKAAEPAAQGFVWDADVLDRSLMRDQPETDVPHSALSPIVLAQAQRDDDDRWRQQQQQDRLREMEMERRHREEMQQREALEERRRELEIWRAQQERDRAQAQRDYDKFWRR